MSKYYSRPYTYYTALHIQRDSLVAGTALSGLILEHRFGRKWVHIRTFVNYHYIACNIRSFGMIHLVSDGPGGTHNPLIPKKLRSKENDEIIKKVSKANYSFSVIHLFIFCSSRWRWRHHECRSKLGWAWKWSWESGKTYSWRPSSNHRKYAPIKSREKSWSPAG